MFDVFEMAKQYGRVFEFHDRRKDVDATFIKNLRLKLDMTQVYFAKVLSVSPKTVEKWETGENKPNGATSLLLYIIAQEPLVLGYAYKDRGHGDE